MGERGRSRTWERLLVNRSVRSVLYPLGPGLQCSYAKGVVQKDLELVAGNFWLSQHKERSKGKPKPPNNNNDHGNETEYVC